MGHQAYAHKLLTGRRSASTPCAPTAASAAFPDRRRAPIDLSTSGHSSTSISAALGMAMARDRKGENHHVVAVIGDGSMTAGLAYEGLNNAGDLEQRPHRGLE